jgi:hypothetical protein
MESFLRASFSLSTKATGKDTWAIFVITSTGVILKRLCSIDEFQQQ